MSIPALSTAILLFGAPVDAAAAPPATPPLQSAPAATEAAAPEPAAPDTSSAATGSPTPAAPASPPVEPSGSAPVPAAEASAPTQPAPTASSPQPGDIVVTGRGRPPPEDPLQELNVKSYQAVQAVDTAVIRPVAMGYRNAVPRPIRDGVRNFINNLREPVVFLNFMLQLKPGKAVETAGRFTINTTAGVAGVFDFAKRKPFKLPRRANGLANTLGYYGVKPGPFLFLPLVGPTTLRDAIGDGLDRLVLPIFVGSPFNKPYYGIPIYVFSSMDQRAEFDGKLQAQHNSADAYKVTREDYLQSRVDAINELHGRPPRVASPAPDSGKPSEQPAPAPPPAAAAEPASPPVPQQDAQ